MTPPSPRSILIIPGLNSSGPTHWQTHWLKRLPGAVWVDQTDWELPRLGDWVASLVQAIREHPGAILVGHSLGCALIAHVAQLRGNKGIGGALMVAPADVNSRSPAARLLQGFSPMPQLRLTFPSIVVASETDPYVSIERAHEFSRAWGSRLVNLGDAGHVNVASGYGPWEAGLDLLDELHAELGDHRRTVRASPAPVRNL